MTKKKLINIAGFTLIEVLIAVGVFIITFYSVIRALKYFKIL